MCARRCTGRGIHPERAGGSISLDRLERLVVGDPQVSRRGDRGGRIDACATSPAPTASSAISRRASPSTTGRGSRAGAAGRCGESSRAAARPSIARAASTEVDRFGPLRVGERPRRRGLLASRRFFIEPTQFRGLFDGEHAASQEAHPPQRNAGDDQPRAESAASGPSSRPSSRRLRRARRPMPPRR